MHIISCFLFAISANIDNLAVGIAYGIKKLKITNVKLILVAFMSCLGTFISMSLGKIFHHIAPKLLSNYLGSIVLIALGIWSLREAFKEAADKSSYEQIIDDPDKVDIDKSGTIDIKEAFLLGFVLAVNNMGMGVGASITGINIPLTSLLTFAFSFIFILFGIHFGKKCISTFIGKFASIFAGVIIILLGVYELFI